VTSFHSKTPNRPTCSRKEPWAAFGCGNSPEDRPDDLQDHLDAGEAPTLEQFAQATLAWIEADYHQRPHGGDGMDDATPAAAFEACLEFKRTAPAELLDVLMLRPTRPVKVRRNGVEYRGLRYGQYHPALIGHFGKEVVLRVDDRDLSAIQVYSPDGRFICLAPANTRLPANADSQLVREAMAQRNRAHKIDKEFRRLRPRLHEDMPDAMRRAAVARAKARPPAGDPTNPPPSMRPVRSPLEDQLPAIQKAIGGQKMAVGAESILPSTFSYTRQGDHAEESAFLGSSAEYLRYRQEDDHES